MKLYVEQLATAWHLVQRGSRAAGIDGITVDLFTGIAREQIHQLYRQMRQERYVARPAKGFYLAKQKGGHRLIGIPTVRDRIVQRYLLQSIYPSLENAFSDAVFAYRPGLSIYAAVKRVMERYRYQPTWVIKADIQQFFDQLSWPLLLHQLDQLSLPATWVQWIEQQLKAGIVVSGQFYQPGQGVLPGSILSGALANLYLNDFDRHCLEADIPLVRYGDDCVAVCQSYLEASRSLALMQDWIEGLSLSFHPEKTTIIPPGQAFVFLGHRFRNGTVEGPARQKAEGRRQKAPQPGYGPPQLCSIVKSPRRMLATSTDDYWRDGMTTLYITDQGSYLRVRHQQFQVFHNQELRCSVPASRISHVVLFGCCNVSHGAVRLALQRRIPLLYLSNKGRYFGRLQTTGQAKLEYLTQQVYKAQDPDFVRTQAASIIIGKLHNSRILLLRLNRRRKTEAATQAIATLAELMQTVPSAESVEAMLGREGTGANLYFQAYASLLKGQFEFEKRTRPPTDPVNSLLSLGYTLLSQNVHAMVEGVGLHTHFGNLHKPQANRPSLVCDLVEEFRAIAVDSLVAYLINSNIFSPDDFTPPDARGGVYLHPDAMKRFLKHWEEKLQQSVTHPHSGYKVSYRRCLELQVWEYVACLMGEQPVYRPMQWEG
ncbi:CRISPR-associated endonuclease Cas1 [Halomicronema hongdechloris C2206]|uniref:CRISPR-associated endonuclease Cas1 n=1 Tax=Halomicronema hongdechloris C2206 TaxID=1641165 RepID=A0A1Z3HGW6_9CYAN|nr:CRISPR-associated endonuclease Cas1 [Halomicronema hongdechloris]ASC69569.1 CRISPR-associated endonuclease Cas1 [Halomicronema hongdechloris C2206]